jgi:hypothetical protein
MAGQQRRSMVTVEVDNAGDALLTFNNGRGDVALEHDGVLCELVVSRSLDPPQHMSHTTSI